MLQNHTDCCFRNIHVSSTRRGHAYKYIIHHVPKPYIAPSIRINTGTTNAIFLPKNKVNMMSQKLVNSILGRKLNATLHTSMTATIIPIWQISSIVIFFFLLSVFVFTMISPKNKTIVLKYRQSRKHPHPAQAVYQCRNCNMHHLH